MVTLPSSLSYSTSPRLLQERQVLVDERNLDRPRGELLRRLERPRLHSGEEIADTLGVTAATIHQHLWKAEQQLLGVAVDGSID